MMILIFHAALHKKFFSDISTRFDIFPALTNKIVKLIMTKNFYGG